MAVSTQTTRVRRVLVALVLAGVLILGAYVLSDPALFAPSAANAESTQALLQAFAQKKGPDGLPVWEDQLIATASSTAWSNEASSTVSADDVPPPGITAATGSLTDQFAQNLFSQFMSQEAGNNPSDQDIDTFAQNAVDSLVQSHSQQDAYSQSEIQPGSSGSAALLTYASAVEDAFNNNTVDADETGLDYFSDAVERNQVYKLKEVASIGSEYTTVAAALMQIPVPPELQTAQLELANAMARIGDDYNDMSTFETDPLRAELGLSAYETDAQSFVKAFADMYTVYNSENVAIQKGQPGYSFYLSMSDGSADSP